MEIWARGEQSCQYSLSADAYSFGITLYEILSRRIPYQMNSELKDCSIFTLRKQICDGSRPILPTDHPLPASFVELMVQCWDAGPERRPSFADICARLERVQVEVGHNGNPVNTPAGQAAAASAAFRDHFPLPSELPSVSRLGSINRSNEPLYE